MSTPNLFDEQVASGWSAPDRVCVTDWLDPRYLLGEWRTTVASEIAPGDLVQASGHAGPWKVLEIRQGLALLEHHDGHRLSVRTTTVEVVRKASPREGSAPREEAESESPSLFDES